MPETIYIDRTMDGVETSITVSTCTAGYIEPTPSLCGRCREDNGKAQCSLVSNLEPTEKGKTWVGWGWV